MGSTRSEATGLEKINEISIDAFCFDWLIATYSQLAAPHLMKKYTKEAKKGIAQIMKASRQVS